MQYELIQKDVVLIFPEDHMLLPNQIQQNLQTEYQHLADLFKKYEEVVEEAPFLSTDVQILKECAQNLSSVDLKCVNTFQQTLVGQRNQHHISLRRKTLFKVTCKYSPNSNV